MIKEILLFLAEVICVAISNSTCQRSSIRNEIDSSPIALTLNYQINEDCQWLVDVLIINFLDIMKKVDNDIPLTHKSLVRLHGCFDTPRALTTLLTVLVLQQDCCFTKTIDSISADNISALKRLLIVLVL
jgi:hypothetical protein